MTLATLNFQWLEGIEIKISVGETFQTKVKRKKKLLFVSGSSTYLEELLKQI